jgi:hypothetical protein
MVAPPPAKRPETALYAPVKAFLEAQGYEVKGEVAGADVVARRGDEPPVVVELKTSFSLSLVLQGVRRLASADLVYLAVPAPETPGQKRHWWGRRRDIRALCRRLGFGLMTVDFDLAPALGVEVLLDPAPYAPRGRPKAKARLLREFQRRIGDPNTGGVSKRGIVTAYRQDALRLAAVLSETGPGKAAEVAAASGVGRAGTMLRADHYGWFERVARGVYRLTPAGEAALALYADVVAALAAAPRPARSVAPRRRRASASGSSGPPAPRA